MYAKHKDTNFESYSPVNVYLWIFSRDRITIRYSISSNFNSLGNSYKPFNINNNIKPRSVGLC
jgi:hypothetical protein